MKYINTVSLALILSVMFLGGCNQLNNRKSDKEVTSESSDKVKRVGMVIKINPDYIDEYKALHADSNSGVRDLLGEANMHNFSIFLHQLDDGNWYEFGYYEYTGNDFQADMEKLGKHPRNIQWLEICDPMQIPLEGNKGWAEMEQVYYNQ